MPLGAHSCQVVSASALQFLSKECSCPSSCAVYSCQCHDRGDNLQIFFMLINAECLLMENLKFQVPAYTGGQYYPCFHPSPPTVYLPDHVFLTHLAYFGTSLFPQHLHPGRENTSLATVTDIRPSVISWPL